MPYTGSGPEACRLAMSKSASKRGSTSAACPRRRYVVIADDASPAEARRASAPLGFPLIIKPDGAGFEHRRVVGR